MNKTAAVVTPITEFAERVVRNVETVIVGKRQQIELFLVALLCQGHVLIEDVPGTGKTMLARAMAASLGVQFKRIQCTPDLLPNDVTGVSVYNQQTAAFDFRPGPVFVNVLLADEINRATPRTQSALLEAMQERQVSIDGTSHALPESFTVFATQNPIEFEGTFPLPEAQLDRFLFKILVGYPSKEEEDGILAAYHAGFDPLRLGERVQAVGDAAALQALRARVAKVTVQPAVMGYITDVVRRTRDHAAIAVGASPRASVALFQAARASAALRGRDFVTPDDVQALCAPVLRHRVLLKPEAEIEGATPDACIAAILEAAPVPR